MNHTCTIRNVRWTRAQMWNWKETIADNNITNCKICPIVVSYVVELTPKFDAENRSLAVAEADVVWAKKALMLARRVLEMAGTPGHMYLVERHEKWLQDTTNRNGKYNTNDAYYPLPNGLYKGQITPILTCFIHVTVAQYLYITCIPVSLYWRN